MSNLNMYAIIDSTEEGYYWNFKTENMDQDLNGQCLLPTKEMTGEYIKNKLGVDYFKVIEVM